MTAHHAKGWTVFPEREDMAGAVLGGRFEVEKRIGRGGMAEVFLSKDLLLHGLAAVKVLREGNTDARRRFSDEGRLLANLRDPHLVRVLAVGETADGAPYMALEYLDGPSLEGRLRGGPLPWREVIDIAGQVAGALAALHRVGVIHRDVKPSNIVQLDGATGRPVAKLIDLGIAKVLDWSRVQGGGFTTSWRRKTEIGQVVGTHGFCPPEAALTEADPRYDTYGLGVTIYQLCTGVLPVPGEYRPMRELAPKAGIPAELEALVEAAVAVLPEDRVASAEEFVRRLEAIRVAHADEATPHLFDGCYELLEVIGAGAKAEVYRAYHRDAGRYVALKLLSVKAQGKPEERLRFAREARVMGAVRAEAGRRCGRLVHNKMAGRWPGRTDSTRWRRRPLGPIPAEAPRPGVTICQPPSGFGICRAQAASHVGLGVAERRLSCSLDSPSPPIAQNQRGDLVCWRGPSVSRGQQT